MTQVDYIITGLLFVAISELKDKTKWERFPATTSLRYKCDEALAEMSVHLTGLDRIALFKWKWRLRGSTMTYTDIKTGLPIVINLDTGDVIQ